jgi:hypothetical protein
VLCTASQEGYKLQKKEVWPQQSGQAWLTCNHSLLELYIYMTIYRKMSQRSCFWIRERYQYSLFFYDWVIINTWNHSLILSEVCYTCGGLLKISNDFNLLDVSDKFDQ